MGYTPGHHRAATVNSGCYGEGCKSKVGAVCAIVCEAEMFELAVKRPT